MRTLLSEPKQKSLTQYTEPLPSVYGKRTKIKKINKYQGLSIYFMHYNNKFDIDKFQLTKNLNFAFTSFSFSIRTL